VIEHRRTGPQTGRVRIVGLKTFVVATPPPFRGGRYWIFVKLVSDCGVAIVLNRRCGTGDAI